MENNGLLCLMLIGLFKVLILKVVFLFQSFYHYIGTYVHFIRRTLRIFLITMLTYIIYLGMMRMPRGESVILRLAAVLLT